MKLISYKVWGLIRLKILEYSLKFVHRTSTTRLSTSISLIENDQQNPDLVEVKSNKRQRLLKRLVLKLTLN